MLRVSPTTEGFRAAFRRPSFTLAEIMWRWVVGATAAALFFFGIFEYLDTLPVSRGEMLFLRSRQPYLVLQAIAHIFRGSVSRALFAAIVAALLLSLFWMVVGALGRIVTVRAMLAYVRETTRNLVSPSNAGEEETKTASRLVTRPFRAVLRLNFLRTSIGLAAVIGFSGAGILAGFVSTDAHARPGLAFLLLMPLAVLVCATWFSLNWFLSLAGMFAVRSEDDAAGAIAAAVAFCRERMGAVLAVSTWTGLAHLAAFVCATTVVSMPLGLAGLLPGRLVVFGVLLVTLGYFVVADWLYTARLAGYICIAELPEELLKPQPVPRPTAAYPSSQMPVASAPPLQTTIDREEPILSDLPNLSVET
jgi:hypothetical protein